MQAIRESKLWNNKSRNKRDQTNLNRNSEIVHNLDSFSRERKKERRESENLEI